MQDVNVADPLEVSGRQKCRRSKKKGGGCGKETTKKSQGKNILFLLVSISVFRFLFFFFCWLCFSHFHFSEPSPVFPLHQINRGEGKKGSRKNPKGIMASFSLLFSPLCFPSLPSVFILACECVFFLGGKTEYFVANL